MPTIPLPDWLSLVELINLVLASAILILAFSLFAYILTFNLHSRVGRSFAALLLGVIIVYSGDVVLPRVEWQERWLRFQWLGIALVPAAYFHFTRSVLLATWLQSERRRWIWLGRAAYALSAAFAVLALATDVLVEPPIGAFPVTYLRPGPLFLLFTFYFVIATLWGGWTLLRARQHVRSQASKRRLSYLLWSFAAPALGVFPYLVLAPSAGRADPALVLLLASVANIAVGILLVVMAYSVAYYGVLSPDRVVKRQLVYFLLRGPFVAVIVVSLILTVPKVEAILGLPPYTALALFVVAVIVLAPLAFQVLQPWIDRLIYRHESEEVLWLRTLETRLMTSSDLSQFLENVLIALADALEVGDGFVALPGETGARLEAVLGNEQEARRILSLPEVQVLLTATEPTSRFVRVDSYLICPLINRHTDEVMGIVALRAPERGVPPAALDADPTIQHLLRRAEIAVEDRRLQLDVFEALRPILPDIEAMQALRGTIPYVITPTEKPTSPLPAAPEFTDWVRDALSDFWGGPKLSESPLLGLRVVRQRLAEYDNSPIRALRAVLQAAIERQRPPGERQMTTSEWLLYNILDLKFIQGKRVREVAHRLAMSESDLYRKQRVAISQVARTLAEMEAAAAEMENK